MTPGNEYRVDGIAFRFGARWQATRDTAFPTPLVPINSRFRISLSFAGEKRPFVADVANTLAAKFGKEKILYDKFHETEFGRLGLQIYLPKLYHDPSDLVVAVFCPDYGKKECCGLEWAAILDLIRKRQGQKIMLCRFGGVEVDGLYGAGFIELDECSPSKCATPILERLALNESKDGEDNSGRTEAVEEVAKSPDTTPRVSGRSEPKNEYPHIVNVVNELLRDSLEVGRFLQGCIFNIFEGNPPAVHLKPSVGWKEIERVPTLDAVVDELRKLEPKLDGLGDVPRRTSPPGLAFLF